VEGDIVRGYVTLHQDGKGSIGYGELHSDIPIQGLSVFYIQPGLIRRFCIREGDQISAHTQSPRGWLTRWHIRQLLTINDQDCELVRRKRQSIATQAAAQVQ
jgi:transcription termination factor Rho